MSSEQQRHLEDMRFLDLPEIKVADDAATIHRSIREVLFQSRPSLNVGALDRRKELLWDNCLAPLTQKVRELFE